MENLPKKPRRDKAKRVARDVILASHQGRLPVDVDDFFRQNGWRLYTVEQAEALAGRKLPAAFLQRDVAEAMTCFYEGTFVTIYKTQDRTSGRIRFTKAHELGHIVLGHLTSYPLGDSFSVQRYIEAKALEREADMFAAELLAPTPVLREIELFDPLRIQAICNISRRAADIVVSDLHRDFDVRESNRYRMLNRFHKYLWAASYYEILYETICPVCKAQMKEGWIYCPVCGTKAVQPLYKDHPIFFHSPMQTRNGRLLFCHRCGNTVFPGGARICQNCGQPLYNHCINPDHPGMIPGFARYCVVCGGPSSFYVSDILPQWRVSLSDVAAKMALWEKTIQGAPFSADWDFWVKRVLCRREPELYIKLQNSVATFEYGDLTIYSEETQLPKDYIRDSIQRYCGVDIVSIRCERGAALYDLS